MSTGSSGEVVTNTLPSSIPNRPQQEDNIARSSNDNIIESNITGNEDSTEARYENTNRNTNAEVEIDSMNMQRSPRMNFNANTEDRLEFPIRIGWLRTRWYTCHTFEEALMTLQPSSAACLLALMAMCNLGSLFFHFYTALWWFSKGGYSTDIISCGGELVCWLSSVNIFAPDNRVGSQSITGYLIWAWLIAQVVVGGLKLCFRFHTKRLCIQFMQNSRRNQIPTNGTQDEIETIMHSVSFRVHKGLGRAAQILALMGYLLYFYIGGDKFKQNVVNNQMSHVVLLDVCCANVVIAFFRAFVALYVLHYYAFQDQVQRLNPAPIKQGFSEFELHRLIKKIKYSKFSLEQEQKDQQNHLSHLDEIQQAQCAICLQAFQNGEVLACLPCDNRHIFHSMCIRTWLSKRDSCPLCKHNLRYL